MYQHFTLLFLPKNLNIGAKCKPMYIGSTNFEINLMYIISYPYLFTGCTKIRKYVGLIEENDYFE